MPSKRPPRNPFASPLESSEQAKSRNLLRAVGWCVYTLDQARSTQQTPGLFDTYALHPGLGIVLWLDSKRAKGGRISPEQKAFLEIHRPFFTFGPVTVYALIGNYQAVENFSVRVGLGYRTETGQFVAKPMMSDGFYEWTAAMNAGEAKRKLAKLKAGLRKVGRITSPRGKE